MELPNDLMDLTDQECDYLIRIWKICPSCKMTFKLGGPIKKCGYLVCHDHQYNDVCASIQSKQGLLIDFVRKYFNTDDVRGAYRQYMRANLRTLTGDCSYNMSDLTKEEGVHLNRLWRICFLNDGRIAKNEAIVSTGYEDNQIGIMLPCECFAHKSANCSYQAKDHAKYQCASKTKSVTDFVEKTFQSSNVRAVYYRYMQDNVPRLIIQNGDGTDDSQLKKELDNAKGRISELEKENEELRKENSAVKVESGYSTAKLVKISQEIKQLKKKYRESQNEVGDFDEKQKDDFDVDTSDECTLNCEWDSFKLQFNELQSKISELGQKCFSTRNTSMILELQQKVFPATITSSDVKEDVLNSLKNGTVKLKAAFDGLAPMERDLPSSSSTKGNRKEQDAKLLD